MIDIKKLTNRDIGREVIFCGEHKGRIVSWKEDMGFVYVRYYKPDKKWTGTAKENKEIGLHSNGRNLEFNGPPKPIVTRADLMDLEED